MDNQQGPYDADICHFCKRSAKNSPKGDPGKYVAGFSRRETYANVGPWFDACQRCAEKVYEVPKQFQKGGVSCHGTND
jgi:hypothetical protein